MSKTVLAGAGAVGTAAMGTITVQMSKGPYSFYPNKLSKFKWTFNTDPKYKNLDLIGGDCVRAFFPGLAYPTEKQMADPRSLKNNIAKPSFPATTAPNPMGCKLIKFTRSPDGKAFVYKSEITARNGSEGLVLSSAITKAADPNSLDYKFWLLYLKKDKGLWKITWEHEFHKHKDAHFSISNPFSFALPRTNQAPYVVELSSDSPHHNFHDAWIWTFSTNGNSPLFYTSSHTKKPNTERDWFMDQNGAALQVYSKFRDLQGTWNRAPDYCGPFKPSPKTPPDKLDEQAREICYIRNY